MVQTVSKSPVGRGLPEPSRQERDEAFSAGGGRKAEEQERQPVVSWRKRKLSAPIGLELETRAARLWKDSFYEVWCKYHGEELSGSDHPAA